MRQPELCSIILHFFFNHREAEISGYSLAKKLGVRRGSVYDALHELELHELVKKTDKFRLTDSFSCYGIDELFLSKLWELYNTFADLTGGDYSQFKIILSTFTRELATLPKR